MRPLQYFLRPAYCQSVCSPFLFFQLAADAKHVTQEKAEETGTLHDNNFHQNPSFHKKSIMRGAKGKTPVPQ